MDTKILCVKCEESRDAALFSTEQKTSHFPKCNYCTGVTKKPEQAYNHFNPNHCYDCGTIYPSLDAFSRTERKMGNGKRCKKCVAKREGMTRHRHQKETEEHGQESRYRILYGSDEVKIESKIQ